MRAKLLSLLAVAVAGAAALLAGSQTWVSFMIDGDHTAHPATGYEINAALTPVAIALVAAALALTIAGKAFRRVLGVLVALLGIGVGAIALGALAAPLAAISGKVTALTGLTGGDDQVLWLGVSGWPWVTLVAGALAVLFGAVILITGGKWAQGGRKYDTEAREGATAGKPDRISDWDALSDGDDPTERS